MLGMLSTFSQYTYDYNYSYSSGSSTSNGPFPWGAFLGIFIIAFVLAVIGVISLWKIFQKAGKPGWAAIIPVYNAWVLFEIVGYPGWWAVLGLIPFVNIFTAVMGIIAQFKLVKLFGKSDGFAVLTIFFPFICLPILAFGKATFQGGQGQGPSQGYGGMAAGNSFAPTQYPGQPAATDAGMQQQPPAASTNVFTPQQDSGQDQQPPQPPQSPQPPTFQ